MIIRTGVKLWKAGYAFSTQRIPIPPNPTMAESFESKLSAEEMKNILDPRGYLSQDEK